MSDAGLLVEWRPGVLKYGKVVAVCGGGIMVEGGEL